MKVAANIPGRDYLCCQKKIQQLKREYLKHKDNLNRSGQKSDVPVPNVIAAHYDLLDEVLSDRPSTPPSTLQSSLEKG